MSPSAIMEVPSEVAVNDLKMLSSISVSSVSPLTPSPSDISTRILDIIFEYALDKFDDTMQQLEVGKPKFLAAIEHYVLAEKRLEMCLPAFPFKSANKVYKVLGSLPDKAEELALERMNTICLRIGEIYPPGAVLTIISDGLVYNDLLSVSDRDTWAYGEALRKMAVQKKYTHLEFSRIRDLVQFPGPEVLNEITYVASATNFRRYLLNEHGKDDLDIDHELATNPDTMMTYLGYRRFLVSDLKHIFPLGDDRSKTSYKKNVKYLAKQMLIRGYAFANACKQAYPDHLRLSIHQSTGANKISVSLLNTKTGFTTPWHCTVAQMADGEWLSAPKGDFEQENKFEVVYEDGRPSYFREKTSAPEDALIESEAVSNHHQRSDQPVSDVYASGEDPDELLDAKFSDDQSASTGSCLGVGGKQMIHRTVESLHGDRGVRDTDGEPVNPFLSSDRHQLLDPKSDAFSSQAWLETLMKHMTKDPARYPRKLTGIAYRSLAVHAFGSPTDYQKTFGNQILALVERARRLFGSERKRSRIQILRDFDGLVKGGEMLVVLGRPGSGCSTLLKTISGETDGLHIGDGSRLNYQGIPREVMHRDFRGECIYMAEIDVHFPQLTVGQTLDFAARARAPRNRLPGVDRDLYAEHLRDATMAMFGLGHTVDTIVGNDFIRGVSGGERKRVSIAEVSIAGSPLQCWDNSTRGLDSATALEFAQTLRMSTRLTSSSAIVSLYQASQSIYDVFDKVAVLYEGRQIYFGNIHAAKDFFVGLGFDCLPRQTTADFLTSLTNPAERRIRDGFEGKTPNTPDEFASVWRHSIDRAQLLKEIEEFDQEYSLGGRSMDEFKLAHNSMQAKSQRARSPYTISLPMQVKLCVRRGYQRLRGDMAILITGTIYNGVMALVIGSVFYNLPNDTTALYGRGALLFFAILLAAFASALEILALYAQRPIVEKHFKYAFYHPFAEAIASMICDLPNKIFMTISFDLALYFMTNLRRTPGHFFVFLLFTFTCTLTMSMYFRCIAALSKTLAQAMAPASIFSLALVIYTGFAIPTKDMHPWFRWLNYLNPVGYAYEALMINEFHGRRIPCSKYVPEGPGYDDVSSTERICSTTGASAGADFIDGDEYLAVNFGYHSSHLWRNFGIMLALMVLGCAIYLLATEYISEQKSKGEVLVFRRGAVPSKISYNDKFDEESLPDDRPSTALTINREKPAFGLENSDATTSIQKQTSIVHWSDVTFTINLKSGPRVLLDSVDGWVRPGTLTTLMGISGAGKTTLLDVLAARVTFGVVSGDILVDGQPRNPGFQRKTGYAQQQDLHLATATVREALVFSALLRQPKQISRKDKEAYVEEVIYLLEMEGWVDAVVGTPGEGLNVEQRKRLTIGVEMAARPELLVFLDEPTSGLDSQTAWSIVSLLRKLANNGQAILCTLHQPSSSLFACFDRLLYLGPGGKTLYFGEIGKGSRTVLDYFEHHGARMCGEDENPAEYILDVVGNGGTSTTEVLTTSEEEQKKGTDWAAIWSKSGEKTKVKMDLRRMEEELKTKPVNVTDESALMPFAESFSTQLWYVLKRGFQQYWRTPSYLYSKVALCLFSALFIGFSFWKTPNSVQGLQNQLFAIFLLITIFTNVCQQIMPHFVVRRALYEARERPSKTYSWQVFMLADILVEIPWNTLMAVVIFVCWYYPIGLQRNAEEAHQVAERGGLMFLFVLAFMNFAGTFTSMALAAFDTAEAAGNIINLLFALSLIFCGVLATPVALPGFWIFMYRVSPFTYLVSGVLSVGLANSHVTCSPDELLKFAPPALTTCSTYLASYINDVGGYLTPESANSTSQCVFCTGSDTNIFLKSVSSEYHDRWRNFGIFWVYLVFNVAAAIGLYWLIRVPKGKREAKPSN